MACLALASAAFVGTHFLLSHPLREPLVRRVGAGPFQGLYSLVALVTFGWMIWVYGGIGDQAPLWVAG
ncbi:MAG TPA: NnrU family protein, partial [Sphingomicrobium sp.]|nr:NnrU family protein [Sphingomicrobium sp.]